MHRSKARQETARHLRAVARAAAAAIAFAEPASHPGLIKRNLIYVGQSEAMVIAVLAVLLLAGIREVPVSWAMTIKGVVSALSGGVAAALAAYWRAAAAAEKEQANGG